MKSSRNADRAPATTAPAARAGWFRRLLKGAAVYLAIIVLTLVLLDVMLIAVGLFPPAPDYGDPKVGWVSAKPTGAMNSERCLDLAAHKVVSYERNEDGLRTGVSAKVLQADSALFKIAVTGDSHTELCAPNGETHFGVMERALVDQGVKSASFAFGAGMYSPLQAYLAVKDPMIRYTADVLVLNLYTGNDFYDMLRVDDRPHFEPTPEGYRIADPVWYTFDPPGTKRRSRILFALRSISEKAGTRDLLVRVRYLRDVAARENVGMVSVLAYMNDLRKAASPAVAYAHAFSAQMLNQQLFFQRFPASKEESLRRVEALLDLIRQENPGRLLVLSPIPSYQLVHEQAVDSALIDVLKRLPITYAEGVRQEGELYDALRVMAGESGWQFVDNLAVLRQHAGQGALYNNADYHIDAVASDLVGRTQAARIIEYRKAQRRAQSR